LCLALSGCTPAINAKKVPTARAYRQIHDNPVSHNQPSGLTQSVLHRFQQTEIFEKSPDDTLRLLQLKAVETGDRRLLFVLSELNYLAGERLRHSVKAWEPQDARDYYLAAAVYAWLFLFADPTTAPNAFDQHFRTACDLYNYGLGWALQERHNTNGVAVLGGGTRRLPFGEMEVEFKPSNFPWPLSKFEQFIVADQFLVRGLSVRNRQAGLGTPLVGVVKPDDANGLARSTPVTALLRVQGGLPEVAQGHLLARLELYSPFDTNSIQVATQTVPLEMDTTISLAYTLNQSLVWRLGMMQFLSGQEHVRTDVYLAQPYRPRRVPVVFVHGTFSSPVWWAEMFNTLQADPELSQYCQFWYFIYNSGNPLIYSARQLREALQAKLRELDPEGRDPALQQMVIIGHSQGGLLTKLTATDLGDKLLEAVFKTNRMDQLDISPEHQAAIRRAACYDALPFVKRVVFICTPHRGSYLAGNFVRRLARRFVTLPSKLVQRASELAGLEEKLDVPKELRGTRTSLDGMAPNNPVLRTLADLPLAPGIKGHSIIAVQGDGDFHEGRDGLVDYDSAHVGYVESEYIVRSFHSCTTKAPTIEEVRRILHEHLRSLPPNTTN
jgi:pimeloyl-ACP methyl ester carboxylesterase